MCFFNTPSAPAVAPVVYPTDTSVDADYQQAAATATEKKRASSAYGLKSTMLTGGLGLSDSTATVQKKTLLGA